MMFSKKTLSGLLVNSKLMIEAALSDDEIKDALLAYSYTEAVLNLGKDILTQAENLAERQVEAQGKKLAAAGEFRKVRRQSQALFVEHINFLRQAYREQPEKLVEFKLNGRIKRKVTDWLLQAKQFYSILLLNEELVEKLSKYGIIREKLEAARDMVNETLKAKETHNKSTGKAQNLKAKRDRALKRLDIWTSELAMVCRYALKDSPQLLEKLGIQVLSDGYQRKKKENEPKLETEGTGPAAETVRNKSKKAAA